MSIDKDFSFGEFVKIAEDKSTREFMEDPGAKLIPIPAMKLERNARFSAFCERFKPAGVPERKMSTPILGYLASVERGHPQDETVPPRWPDAMTAWDAAEVESLEDFILNWREGLHSGSGFWQDMVRIYDTDSDYVKSLYGDGNLPAKMVKAQIPAVTIEFPEMLEELADLAFAEMPQSRWWTLRGASQHLGMVEGAIQVRVSRVSRIHQHREGSPYQITWNDAKTSFHVRLKNKELFIKAFGGLQFREDAWD